MGKYPSNNDIIEAKYLGFKCRHFLKSILSNQGYKATNRSSEMNSLPNKRQIGIFILYSHSHLFSWINHTEKLVVPVYFFLKRKNDFYNLNRDILNSFYQIISNNQIIHDSSNCTYFYKNNHLSQSSHFFFWKN